MSRYTIELKYTTGDSFESYETSGELGLSWENLDRAKEALARIREMDEVERENDRLRYDPKNGGKGPRRLENCAGYSSEFSTVCIMLPLDDGTEHQHSTFWRGYFETLHSAKIIRVAGEHDESMEYRAKDY
jgi:hypothetical protein